MAVDYYFVGQSAGNSSTGTITPAQFGPQSANSVLSGPTTGAAANPTFRALVAGDIPSTLNATTFPSISFTNLTKLSDTANGTLQITSSTGTALPALTLVTSTPGQGLKFSQAGVSGHAVIQSDTGGGIVLDVFAFRAVGTGFSATTTGGPSYNSISATNYGLGFADATHANIYTNGISALSIDSSQNATFSATVKVQSGGTIRSGSGAPAGALGSVGDIYLNTAAAGGTTNFYVKTGASTWTAVA